MPADRTRLALAVPAIDTGNVEDVMAREYLHRLIPLQLRKADATLGMIENAFPPRQRPSCVTYRPIDRAGDVPHGKCEERDTSKFVTGKDRENGKEKLPNVRSTHNVSNLIPPQYGLDQQLPTSQTKEKAIKTI